MLINLQKECHRFLCLCLFNIYLTNSMLLCLYLLFFFAQVTFLFYLILGLSDPLFLTVHIQELVNQPCTKTIYRIFSCLNSFVH